MADAYTYAELGLGDVLERAAVQAYHYRDTFDTELVKRVGTGDFIAAV